MKNHFQSFALLPAAISMALLAGCETNPAIGNFVKSINQATTPTSNAAQTATSSNQKRADAPLVMAESQTRTANNNKEYLADNRVESTGLLGKTLTSKIKYSKSWHGELPFFNAYMVFDVTNGRTLPKNTSILNLKLDTNSTKKEIFAFVRGNKSKAYFIDLLEVNVSKEHSVLYTECQGGDIGLFRSSTTDGMGNYSNPVKAWSVVNGRFIQLTNISMMTCVDPSDGI